MLLAFRNSVLAKSNKHKVESHSKMSLVKTECGEVVHRLTKYVTYVLYLNILILIDSLLTHKPLLCP